MEMTQRAREAESMMAEAMRELDPKERAQVVASVVGRFVNSYGCDLDVFVETMGEDHRTLQQCFTKLVLKWLEACAEMRFGTDLRNQASCEVAHKMVSAFKSDNGDVEPHKYIPFI